MPQRIVRFDVICERGRGGFGSFTERDAILGPNVANNIPYYRLADDILACARLLKDAQLLLVEH